VINVLLRAQVELWQVVDKESVKRDLQSVLDKGIKSIAVVFMHSYLYVIIII
jgi:5-oxoprolinase (ATP-hydrolysing)